MHILIVGTNPGYKAYELSHAVRAAKIKFFIVEPEILENALKAADENGLPRDRVLIFDGLEGQVVPEGFKSWRVLLEQGEDDWVRFDDLETSKNTTAGHLFSSGTTGGRRRCLLTGTSRITELVYLIEGFGNSKDRYIRAAPPVDEQSTTPLYKTLLPTGLPKAAYINQYNIIAQHVLINEWKPKPYEVGSFWIPLLKLTLD